MKRTYQILYWVFVIDFLAAAVVYIFWMPYRPASVYRAIPSGATFVSAHTRLGAQLMTLSTNAEIQSLLAEQKLAPTASVLTTLQSPRTQAALTRLLGDQTVFAYVPALGSSGAPAWVATSWIGRNSLYLRWALTCRRIAGLKQDDTFRSRPVWSMPQVSAACGMRVSVAFGEGIMMICASHDPSAMRELIMAYDGQRPSLYSTDEYARLTPSEVANRGLVRLAPSTPNESQGCMKFAVYPDGVGGLHADFRNDQPRAPLAALGEFITNALPGNLLGDAPQIVAIIPPAMLAPKLASPDVPPWLRLAGGLLDTALTPIESNAVVLAVLGDDYNGHFGKEPLRISVPCILTMVKISDANGAKPAVESLLENINALYRQGLTIDPEPMMAGAASIFTISGAAESLFADLPQEERMAVAVIDNWLVFASNARALVKLTERMSAPDKPLVPPADGWQQLLARNQPAAMTWIDLPNCKKTLQLALTFYAMNLRGSSSTALSPALPVIALTKTYLEHACTIRRVTIWMESGTNEPQVHVEACAGSEL